MTDGFPRVPFPAPQNRAGRRGLLASAVDLTGLLPPEVAQDERWAGGFEFDPESCDTAELVAVHCAPPGDDKTAGDNPGLRSYDPFVVVGSDTCTTMNRGRDRVGRATRLLLATQSDQVEAEFWDGTLARAEGLPNGYLADPAAVTVLDAPDGAARALADLEQGLAECLHGQRGMIHATPTTVTIWAALGLLRFEGPAILTALDTIVVAGSGYSGSGPVAGSAPAPPADLSVAAFAYGTGVVYTLLGAVVPADEGDVVSRVDRSVNDETVFVERPVAAFWDGCCLLGVEVDHTNSGIGDGSVDGGSP